MSPFRGRQDSDYSGRRGRFLGWGGCSEFRNRLAEFFDPALAILWRCIVLEPNVGVAADVGAVPMQIVSGESIFFSGGQNVAKDQAVQIAVRKMVGEVEHDPPLEQSVDRPTADRAIRSSSAVGLRQDFNSGSNHWLIGRIGALPGQHRRQEFVLDRSRQFLDVHAGQSTRRNKAPARPAIRRCGADARLLRAADL